MKISFLWKDSKNDRMKKVYCNKCNKDKKLKNPKISYIFENTSVLSIICDMMKKYLKKKIQLRYWKFLF